MSVLFLFLLGLSLGIESTMFWIPERNLGRGYFQLNSLISLGLLGIATTVMAAGGLAPWGDVPEVTRIALYLALTGGFLYYAALWVERWRLARAFMVPALAANLVAYLTAGAWLFSAGGSLPHSGWLLTAALLSGSLLLGWSLVTMLLAHWYLISPKLSFRYLTFFCIVLLAIVVLRILAVGASLGTALAVDPMIEPHPWRLLAQFGGQGVFFWFRLLWGLIMPLALAVMSLHCARNRSNESATGILYVLVVGSLIGEITALYLTLSTGVPV